MRRSLIVASAVGATIGLSFLPYSEKMMLHTKGRLHLWGHGLIFGLLTLVALWSLKNRRGRTGVLFGLLLFAAGLEVAQHFVYHSPVEPMDIGADVLGIMFATAGVLLKGLT